MPFTPDIIEKMLLAILVGGAIGAEREYHSKSAGFKTLTLICLGSAMFTVFSTLIGSGNNPDRIALRKYCRWCRSHTDHRETR